MERLALLLGGCLLVAVLAIGGIAGGVDGGHGLGPPPAAAAESLPAAAEQSPPQAEQPPQAALSSLAAQSPQVVAEQPSPLQVRVEPERQTLGSDGPASYAVTVFNPADDEYRFAFLTVGVSPPEKDVGLTVENSPPWFIDDNKLLWAKTVRLPPGEYEVYGVAVPPAAAPGEYEINSTISYVDGGNYTQTWDTAGLTVQSCRSVSGWISCNWQWLLSAATLVVAVLAFFGFERVRGGMAGVLGSWGGDGGG